MRRIILIIAFLSVVPTLWAQTERPAQHHYDLNRFDGVKSEGDMPLDLRLSLDELYSLDKQRVRDYTDGKLPNSDKVLSASYHINKLMASGRILYGDPLTRLVERIADTLLHDYPSLRRELRFYTIKSPEVNAFATGQGMVFVCTGLLAQVENEAQLAFVISHEVIHYLRKHSLENITRTKHDSDDIDAETQEMRYFIKYHNRSHEMESEADSLGLTMFYLDSPYDKGVTEGFFDVLQYSYLPFDEIPFDSTYFDTRYYKMPPEYFLKEVAPITARDDYDDSLSTHPNILKRRTRTASVVAGRTGGARFVVTTPDEFDHIRTLARLECIRQDIIHAEYARAFYDCYLMHQLMPDNAYVDRAMCQALYGLSKHKTYANNSSAVGNYKDFEGEVQQSYYFFRQVKREDLALITARRLWESHRLHPDDQQISDMCSDIFADLYEKFNYKPDFFATDYTATGHDTATSQNTSTYQRLKNKKNKQQSVDPRTYVFTDLLQNDPTFASYLQGHLSHRTSDSRSLRSNEKQIIYNPSYLVVSTHPVELHYQTSDRKEQKLYSHISQAAAANGIVSENFSDQSLHTTLSSERYNDFVDIVEWVNEFWNTEGNFDMLNSMQPAMNRISNMYDASSINMTTVLNMKNLGRGMRGLSFYMVIIPPLLPAALESILSSTQATVVHSVQIDAHTGHTLKKSTYSINYGDEPARVTNALYDHYRTAIDSTQTTPGFMGSRFMLTASANLGYNNVQSDHTSFPRRSLISLGAQLNAGIVVGRSSMLEASANFQPTAFNDDVNSDIYSLFVNYRIMSKQQPAPVGRSLAFGLGWGQYRLAQPFENHPRNNNFFGIHLDISRNYSVARHLALGYTIQYNFFLNPLHFSTELNKKMIYNNLLRLGLTVSLIP